MTRTIPSTPDWRRLGRTALCLALDVSGTVLTTTGRVLLVCGLQLQALSARLGPQ